MPRPARLALPLHDALPISPAPAGVARCRAPHLCHPGSAVVLDLPRATGPVPPRVDAATVKAHVRWTVRVGMSAAHRRSEEHTSELQSRDHLVCRLLLDKTK